MTEVVRTLNTTPMSNYFSTIYVGPKLDMLVSHLYLVREGVGSLNPAPIITREEIRGFSPTL